MDEPPLSEVRAHTSFLTSRMEELAFVEDSCFSLVEDRIETLLMGFLEYVFPPPS